MISNKLFNQTMSNEEKKSSIDILHQIQSIIDDNKQKISDNTYLKLCSNLKKLCDEKAKYVRVHYFYTKATKIENGYGNRIRLSIHRSSLILKKREREIQYLTDIYRTPVYDGFNNTMRDPLRYRDDVFDFNDDLNVSIDTAVAIYYIENI